MRRFLALILMLSAPVAAAYEETLEIPSAPDLRVALGPRDAVETYGYVGAEFVLRIQLVSAFAFEALRFEPPVIENARTVRVLSPRTKAVSTFEASGFVYETAFAVFPERPGVLVIPPLVATGVIEPQPGQPAPFRSETFEERIEIRDIPPEFQGDEWVVSRRLDFEETWSKPPEEAAPGDILRRRVTLTAFGVEAERLPDLTLGPSRGAIVSDHGGARETLLSSDGVKGKVTREWDIRIADPRVAIIGPVSVEHWHPGFHRSLRAEAPARRVEPRPVDPEARAAALKAEASSTREMWRMAGLAAAALILFPVAMFVAACLAAVAPSRADLRLKRDLARTAAPEAVWAAVDRWTVASGVDPARIGTIHSSLPATLFASAGEPPDTMTLRAEMLKASRTARLEKLFDKARTWLSSVIGPKITLQG